MHQMVSAHITREKFENATNSIGLFGIWCWGKHGKGSHIIIWLAPWTGKTNQIAHCDWLPERQAGTILPLGTTRCVPREKFPRKPNNKSFVDQGFSVKMAGYWPRSSFASLWTSTPSRSTNTQKKNLANIQPSWPHTWSITHINSNYFQIPLVWRAFSIRISVDGRLDHSNEAASLQLSLDPF